MSQKLGARTRTDCLITRPNKISMKEKKITLRKPSLSSGITKVTFLFYTACETQLVKDLSEIRFLKGDANEETQKPMCPFFQGK